MTMSSLPSINDLAEARSQLEQRQRESYQELGLAPPEPRPDQFDAERWTEYFKTNPDSSAEDASKTWQEYLESNQLSLPDNVASVADKHSSQLLARSIQELRSAWPDEKYPQILDRICFGLVPAGGLDAFTFRASGVNAYGVVIPEGMFQLANLFSKVVILLQPSVHTAQGPSIYSQMTSMQQFQLASHPYIRFRIRDLLRALFGLADPEAALPYRSAIPFQDRLSYLLIGTELFVLAHEAAHVALGHFDRFDPGTYDLKAELDADAVALEILAKYFGQKADYGTARASLCGFLFLSIMKLWEGAVQHALKLENVEFRSDSHPTFKKRIRNFARKIDSLQSSETPRWYIYIHTAIQFATDIGTEELSKLVEQGGGARALNIRVMPDKYAHLANTNASRPDERALTIANLILAQEPVQRRLGLWFLSDFGSWPARNIYDGILDEDQPVQEIYRKAICSIEPLYQSYLPRLIERFREEDREDNLQEYKQHLSEELCCKAAWKLGDDADQADPVLVDYGREEQD
jgi:hypothetical protein